MKVKLLRQNRIDGNAGEIVEVSPARAAFLFEMKLAEPAPIRERAEMPDKKLDEIKSMEKGLEKDLEQNDVPKIKTAVKKTARGKK